MVRQRSLRWLGHVVKKVDNDCVEKAWRFEVEVVGEGEDQG